MNDMKQMISAEAFEEQMRHGRLIHTFTACCAVCGKKYKKRKKWYDCKEEAVAELRKQFNYCDVCGKWVCDDCHIVEDGNGNPVYDKGQICAACAKERGITGISVTYYNEKIWPEKWPLIQERQAELRKQREQAAQKGELT